ncbi:MAG: hypothetical protein WBW41_13610 [Verrucomicrobiia bacterium]
MSQSILQLNAESFDDTILSAASGHPPEGSSRCFNKQTKKEYHEK